MKIACSIMSFNRPHYLARVIKSLEENTLAKNVDWYMFQDGRSFGEKNRANQEDISKCVVLVTNSRLPFDIDIAQENCGVARQKQKAQQLLKEYDVVIFFEDDMIVSPFYIEFLLKMHKQFPDYIVHALDYLGKSNYTITPENLKKVVRSYAHFWGYLVPRSLATLLIDGLGEYIDFIGPDYYSRPHEKIREKWGVNATSHDAILETILKNNDVQKIMPVIPRARYIGEVGLHSNRTVFERSNFHNTQFYVFPEDGESTDDGKGFELL